MYPRVVALAFAALAKNLIQPSPIHSAAASHSIGTPASMGIIVALVPKYDSLSLTYPRH